MFLQVKKNCFSSKSFDECSRRDIDRIDVKMILQGMNVKGKVVKKEITKDLKRLKFSRQLVSIDLTPLSKCPELEKLRLNYNKLTTIDLTPLTHCRKLHTIDLKGNQFNTLDLNTVERMQRIENSRTRRKSTDSN